MSTLIVSFRKTKMSQKSENWSIVIWWLNPNPFLVPIWKSFHPRVCSLHLDGSVVSRHIKFAKWQRKLRNGHSKSFFRHNKNFPIYSIAEKLRFTFQKEIGFEDFDWTMYLHIVITFDIIPSSDTSLKLFFSLTVNGKCQSKGRKKIMKSIFCTNIWRRNAIAWHIYNVMFSISGAQFFFCLVVVVVDFQRKGNKPICDSAVTKIQSHFLFVFANDSGKWHKLSSLHETTTKIEWDDVEENLFASVYDIQPNCQRLLLIFIRHCLGAGCSSHSCMRIAHIYNHLRILMVCRCRVAYVFEMKRTTRLPSRTFTNKQTIRFNVFVCMCMRGHGLILDFINVRALL